MPGTAERLACSCACNKEHECGKRTIIQHQVWLELVQHPGQHPSQHAAAHALLCQVATYICLWRVPIWPICSTYGANQQSRLATQTAPEDMR